MLSGEQKLLLQLQSQPLNQNQLLPIHLLQLPSNASQF
jgi:hypothetical protein